MDRRSFIRLLGAGLVAPIIEPKIKYILPPIGGWQASEVVLPYLTSSSAWFLMGKDYYEHLKMYNITDERSFRQKYLDERASEIISFKPFHERFIDLSTKHKQRSS